jgi:hypothetical protein
VAQDGGCKVEGFFEGLQSWRPFGAIRLVACNALLHLGIKRQACGKQNGATVRRLRKPLGCQHFSPAGFATLLATQNKFGHDYTD